MEKVYINVPAGDWIIENKEFHNSLFFLNLYNAAVMEDSEKEDHFKSDFMSLLLMKNKLIIAVEEVTETAYQMAYNYGDEGDSEISVERVLDELVEEGYFIQLTD